MNVPRSSFLLYLSLCVGLLLISPASSAQTPELDSLKSSLVKVDQDSLLANVLLNISFKHSFRSERDSTEKYLRWGLSFQNEALSPFQLSKLYKNTGTCFFIFGEYDSAAFYYQKGIGILEDRNTRNSEWANLMLGLGNIASYRSEVQTAIHYWIAAAQVNDSLMLPGKNLKVFANLGTAYSMLVHFEQAEYYYQKALPLAEEQGDLRSMANCYAGLGGIYEKQQRYNKADSCFQLCLGIADQLREDKAYRLAYFGIGKIRLGQERYQEAIDYFQLALKHAASSYDQALSHLRIGIAHHHLGAYAKADQAYLRAKDIFQRIGVMDNVIEIWKHLTDNKVSQGDFEQAFEYFQMYYRKTDSMVRAESKQKYEEIEIKFRTEQQKLENLRLQTANTAQELKLQQVQDQARQRLLLVLLLVGLLLAGIVGFVLYRRSAEQKRRIAEQASQLHLKQIEQLQQTQKIAAMQAMVAGQEAERGRLARDLHDSLGGLLSTVQLHFANAVEDKSSVRENQSFERAMHLLQKASKEIRETAHNLMPANLMNFGLVAALEDFIAEINVAGTLTVEFQSYGMEARLPEIYERTLYRIIQELVNNILKHAQAGEVLIQLFKKENRLHLTVEDDGMGFNPDQVKQDAHFGLSNIQSRVNFLNGNMDIDSKQDKGTAVYMEFYLNNYDTFTRRG